MGWVIALCVANMILLLALYAAVGSLRAMILRMARAVDQTAITIDSRAEARAQRVKLADGEKWEIAKSVIREMRKPVEPRY